MSAALALARRELSALFSTPLGWAFATAFLAVEGLLFWTALSSLAAPDAPRGDALELLFGGNLYFWLSQLVLVPLLTARVLAGERPSGVLQTLLAAPISSATLVVGKFLGVYLFYLALWLPTLAYAAFVAAHGPVDGGALASGYLGVALVGAPWVAVALLASAMTTSAPAAAALGFAALFALYGVGLLEPYATAGSGLASWLNLASLSAAMADFGAGIVDLRRVAFALALTALALFVAARALESRRLR